MAISNSNDYYYLGVDVGTSSVRAAFVNKGGEIFAKHSMPIQVYSPGPDVYQQSSLDIWDAVCSCVGTASRKLEAELPAKPQLRGMGFAATCSLVVVGRDGNGLTVDPSGRGNNWDVIMWMDHRAKDEAKFINGLKHPVLASTGGTMSCEMQTPKLLWIKNNLPDTWNNASHFFDLSDFLTWKATGGSLVRSLCSTVCKWTYRGTASASGSGWSEDYFKEIGLERLLEEGYARIGDEKLMVSPGCKAGYLDEKESGKMNIFSASRIPVAASLIDAHAGALGMLATRQAEEKRRGLQNQLGIIAGTSTCHMILNDKPVFVPGVWGPYQSAIVSNMWLHEGGQSAVGKLLDFVVETHCCYAEALDKAGAQSLSVQDYLHHVLKDMAKNSGLDEPDQLTRDFHVWPDFYGNRCPLADPNLKGMMSGLSLDQTVQDLALKFLAAVQALAYGTKHIVQQLTENGYEIDVVSICGGLSRSNLFVQTNADVLSLEVVRPKQSDSVLVGAAMLGAGSDEAVERSTAEIIHDMQGEGEVFRPNANVSAFHKKKYRVFLSMLEDQRKYENIMTESESICDE